MTMRQAVQFGRTALAQGSASALLDARILLCHTLGVERSELERRIDQILPEGKFRRYQSFLSKRQSGEPIAYVLGVKEFYGHEFYVDRRVLIPRVETEQLVELAIQEIAADTVLQVLDVGTGSGNIAVSIARSCPLIPVIATDISQAALDLAQRNARNLGVERQIEFRQGDLLEPIRDEELSRPGVLIIANLPYVPSRYRVMPELGHEPAEMAIFAGEDGLDLYRQFLRQLRERAPRKFVLYVEIHHDQASTLQDLVTEAVPEASVAVIKDYSNHDRFMRVCQNP